MGLKLLITGAAGFAGRHVVDGLAGQGFRITATDREPELFPEKPEVEYVSGDLSTSPLYEDLKARGPFDGVVHLAAVLPQTDKGNQWETLLKVNVTPVFSLLELAREQGARIIFPSTVLVYGNQKGPFGERFPARPEVPYALSKLMAEEAIRFYGRRYAVNYTIFRLGILYGPHQRGSMFIPALVRDVLAGRDFAMTGGEQLRDFLYIDDFVRAVSLALAANPINGVFNLGTGVPTRLKEVAQTVQELIPTGGKVLLGALPYREQESWDYRMDPSLAGKELGWRYRTSLAEGLKKTVLSYSKTTQANSGAA